LQKRPAILRSLLIVDTPYHNICTTEGYQGDKRTNLNVMVLTQRERERRCPTVVQTLKYLHTHTHTHTHYGAITFAQQWGIEATNGRIYYRRNAAQTKRASPHCSRGRTVCRTGVRACVCLCVCVCVYVYVCVYVFG